MKYRRRFFTKSHRRRSQTSKTREMSGVGGKERLEVKELNEGSHAKGKGVESITTMANAEKTGMLTGGVCNHCVGRGQWGDETGK